MTGLVPLRWCVSVSTACALVGVAGAGLVRPWFAVATFVAATGCSWGAPRLQQLAPSPWVRFAAGFALQALMLAAAVGLSGAGVHAVLLALVAGALVSTALEHTTRRALMSALWLAAGILVLGAAAADGPAVVVVVTGGALAALLALVVSQRLEVREPAVPASRHAPAPSAVPSSVPSPARSATVWSATVWRWTVLPVAAALALALGAAALVAARDLVPDVPSQQSAPGLPGAEGRPGERTAQAYQSGTLDLRSRGALPDDPQYAVPDGSPALWRSAVLDDYDGSTWRATPDAAWPPVLLASGPGALATLPVDAGTPDGGPAGLATPDAGAVTSWDVRVLADSYVVVAPGVVGTVAAQPQVDAEVGLGQPGQVLIRRGDGSPVAAYRVGSTPRATTADDDVERLRAVPVTGAAVDPRWTRLAASVPQRVRELGASLAAGSRNRYEAVVAVERYLEDRATYRQDSPVPPPGTDAVDHFLFEARTGFCEQFASAEVLLLRAAGVPARLATGFGTDATPTAGGSRPWDSGATVPGGYHVLRADQAHAWVEVWFPGTGWVTSDPTRGVAAAPGSESVGGQTDPPWRPGVLTGVLTGALTGLLLGLLLVAAGVAAVVVAVVRARRGARRPRAGSSRAAPDGPRRVPAELSAAFERLERALDATGAPLAPTESLDDLAARLPGDVAGAGAAAQPLAVYGRALYGPARPERQEVDAAVAALDALSTSLVASARADGAGRATGAVATR